MGGGTVGVSCREIWCHWYTKRAVRDVPFFAAESDNGSSSYGFGKGLSVEDRDGKASLQWDCQIDAVVLRYGGVCQAGAILVSDVGVSLDEQAEKGSQITLGPARLGIVREGECSLIGAGGAAG